MRTLFLAVLLLVLLVLAAVPVLAQGKIAVDPDSPAAPPEQAAQVEPTDARLLQKVTYEGGYKRLHVVLEDLSKAAGVTIRCGASKKDWQVRDLPVTVHAKDIPLGKLLRAIADATHLTFGSFRASKAAPVEETNYRIWLSPRLKAEREKFLEDKRKARLAYEEWAWDELVRAADLPDEAAASPDEELAQSLRSARALGKVLAALGAEGKQALLAGSRIDVNIDNFKQKTLLYDLYQSMTAHATTRADVSPGDLQWLSLTIARDTDGAGRAADAELRVHLGWAASLGKPRSGVETSFTSVAETAASGLKDSADSGRPLPDFLLFLFPPDHPSPDLVPAGPLAALKSGADPDVLSRLPKFGGKWQSPMLDKRVKLARPDKKDLTVSDVLGALHRAAGYTVVCEDFWTHARVEADSIALPRFSQISDLFGKETSVGELLVRLGDVTQGDEPGLVFYHEDKAGIIVGQQFLWLDQHSKLMPADVLDYLQRKSNGPGLDFDDIFSLTQYSRSQRDEWIYHSRELNFIPDAYDSQRVEDAVWQLYANLSEQDRALALSDSGFPLAKLDPQWITGLVRTRVEPGFYKAPVFAEEEAAEQKALFDALTNPEAVRDIVLREKRRTVRGYDTDKGPKREAMSIEIYGEPYGEKSRWEIEYPYIEYPVYSPKRLRELLKRTEPKPEPAQ